MPSVIVVGGGVAGLTAALDLSRSGLDVLVLDASDRPGGKLRLEHVAGVAVDVGAEATLAIRPETLDLVRNVGLGDRIAEPVTTSSRLWTRNGLQTLPSPSIMGVPADPSAALGILTQEEVTRLRAETSYEPLTQDVAVGAFVAERLGDAVVDRLVDPLLGGIYAGDSRQISMQSSAPQLWAIAARGGSLTEAAAAMLTAPRRPTQRGAIMAGLAGGLGALPAVLVEAIIMAGGRVEPNTIVTGLTRTASGWRVTSGPTNAPVTRDADAVILATPPTPTARLLAAYAPEAAGILIAMDTASMAIITLAFRADDVGELPGSGFLVPNVDGRTIKASTFSSAKWGWLAAEHPDLSFIRTSVGRAGDAEILQRPDEELIATSITEVSEAVGRRLPQPVDTHVHRWGGGLPQYAVGHPARIARLRDLLTDQPTLGVCGAAYDGVGIPAVIASAHRAAQALTETLTREGTPA